MVASSQRRLSVSHVLSAARHPRRDEATCREAQRRGRWGWRGGWRWDLQWGGGGGGRFGPVGMSSVMSAPSVASARERRRRPRRRGERSARGGEDGAARRRPQRVGVGGSGVCRRMQAYAGVCRRMQACRSCAASRVRRGASRRPARCCWHGAAGERRRGEELVVRVVRAMVRVEKKVAKCRREGESVRESAPQATASVQDIVGVRDRVVGWWL